MAARMVEIGRERNRVLVVDDFMDEPQRLVDQARAMAPFPGELHTYYPGLRRHITPEDRDTHAHVTQAMEALAPLLSQAFGVSSYKVIEASFSLVTRPPDTLLPAQRAPHVDETDPGHLAVLHYLSPVPQGGTSFYRHRATGFERIGPERVGAYATLRQAESKDRPARYFRDSDDEFERVARFEARFNRLLVYQGSLLHSGDIPDDFAFSPDPDKGRLTCNIFVRAK